MAWHKLGDKPFSWPPVTNAMAHMGLGEFFYPPQIYLDKEAITG